MLIDWFTTLAQIANFLILVFLLKHFLYGPIIRAMDKREEKIAKRLDDAESAKEEAKEQKKSFEEKSEELEEQKESLLEKAKEKAEDIRREKLKEAERSIEEKQRTWQRELDRQQQTFLDEVSRRSARQVFLIAGKALEDLAGQNLQNQMIDIFLDKLKTLETPDTKQLRKELDKQKEPSVTIVGAFAIESSDRGRLTRALRELLGKSLAVEYERDEGLVAGLRLDCGNSVVGWNLDSYLQDMRKELSEYLETRQKRQGGTGDSGEEHNGDDRQARTEKTSADEHQEDDGETDES
ncbi:MAG: F0F1 ATP synthase subunit delta [Desulfocapsaceae bacterium]|jgi:F-type H+-transporting ATPase subunit b|nr:F0F1 ATP synthase subunit delta [Desulfocapsaceae bacterium]